MKNKILTGVSILFGMMFLNAGLNKFLNYMPVPDGLPEAVVKDNAAMMEISWLLPLIAIVEISGGLLVMPPKTKAAPSDKEMFAYYELANSTAKDVGVTIMPYNNPDAAGYHAISTELLLKFSEFSNVSRNLFPDFQNLRIYQGICLRI